MWDVLREEDVVGEEGDVWKHGLMEVPICGSQLGQVPRNEPR